MLGAKNMLMGCSFLFVGLLITGVTYLIAPGGKYVIASGAMAVGGLQLVFGLLQRLAYRLKSPEARQRAHVEATAQAIVQTMLATCIADKVVTALEVDEVSTIYEQIFGHSISRVTIKSAAARMTENDFDIEMELSNRNATVDPSLRPLILEAAYRVAAADDISSAESTVLKKIADALHIDDDGCPGRE